MALPKNEIPTFSMIQHSTGKNIKYRPFLNGESKAILLAANGSPEEMLLAMQTCVDICTFHELDIPNLPNFDLEEIFLQIRAKSAGEVIELVLTCKNCKGKEDYKLNIGDVHVVDHPEHNKKIILSNNLGVIMKYPTITQLENLTQNYSTETVFNTVIDCIDYIFDDKATHKAADEPREELVAWVDELTTQQMELIEHFFKTIPALKHEFKHTCPKCGTENEYRMVGLESFFG